MGQRVLHVTDAWAAGVASAVVGWIGATSDLEHIILGRGRTGTPAPRPEGVRWIDLPSGVFASWRAVRRWSVALDADVVHAHSSRAGVVVRVLPRRRRGSAPDRIIAYTPHAFAFQRTDIGVAPRRLIRWIETVLGRGRSTTIACGEGEGALARGLRTRRCVVVPYAAPALPATWPTDGHPLADASAVRVAFGGRLGPQKDPAFAAAVARHLTAAAPSCEPVWIGGGDERHAATLVAAGVRCTGWLPREAALGELAAATVYVHTAAWEGLPVSVLEAMALGVPVVARRLAVLDELSIQQGDTPEAVAALVASLVDDPAARTVFRDRAHATLAARPDGTELGRRLRAAYGSAVE